MLLVLLVGGAGVGGYYAWFHRESPKPQPDMEAAVAANLRGVGLMEQLKFAEAEKEFAEAVRLAPIWLPARINLGIAKYNQPPPVGMTESQHIEKAEVIFRAVLQCDPNNLRAHYCLGILADYFNKRAEAYEHFSVVNKADPNDAHTWLMVGRNHPDGADSPAACACYEKALAIDLYLNEARYRLAKSIGGADPARQKALLAEHVAIRNADRHTASGFQYPQMGKYANAFAHDP